MYDDLYRLMSPYSHAGAQYHPPPPYSKPPLKEEERKVDSVDLSGDSSDGDPASQKGHVSRIDGAKRTVKQVEKSLPIKLSYLKNKSEEKGTLIDKVA